MKPEYRILTILGAICLPIVIIAIVHSNLSSKQHDMYLYNPHNATLMVSIDNEQYSLKYREKLKVDLNKGEHSFKSTLNNTKIKDTTLLINNLFYKEGGIINMSNESLYLWKEQYGGMTNFENLSHDNDSTHTENPIEKARENSLKIVKVDTTYLIGNITEFSKNEILVTRDWYYGIDKSFEEEIEIYDTSSSIFGKTIAKIFSKEDALDYWYKNYSNED